MFLVSAENLKADKFKYLVRERFLEVFLHDSCRNDVFDILDVFLGYWKDEEGNKKLF